jgi:hypothetical protein
LDKISQKLASVGIIGHGARGHGYGQILTLFAGLIFTSSMITPLGFKMAALLKVDKGIQVGIYHQIYIAPLAPLAAVGSAKRDVFLTTEADTAVAPVASFYVDFGFIKEHGDTPRQMASERYYTTASTLMQGI